MTVGFWQFHLLFAASFCAMSVWMAAFGRFLPEGWYGRTLAGMRLVFLISLCLPFVVPLLFRALPSEALTPARPFRLAWDIVPAGEVMSGSGVAGAREAAMPGSNLNCLGLWLTLLWCGLCAWRLAANLRKLRDILKRACVIRSCGRVRIAVADDLIMPFATRSLGVAWVVVPTLMVEKYDDFVMAVKHELQHHRQRDSIWIWVLRIVDLGIGWSPAFLGWQRLFSLQQELACDEALVRGQSPLGYASFLLEQARRMSQQTLLVATGLLWRDSPSVLKTRVEAMFRAKRAMSPLRFSMLAAFAVVLSATVLAVAGVSGFARESFFLRRELNADVQTVLATALRVPAEAGVADVGLALVARAADGVLIGAVGFERDATTQAIQWKDADWAVTLPIEPASLMKPLVAAALLESGRASAEERLNCADARFVIEGQSYRDWKPEAQHSLTVGEAVAQSANLCTLVAARRAGLSFLSEIFARFGIAGVRNLHGADALVRAAMGVGWTTPAATLLHAYGQLAGGTTAVRPEVRRSVAAMLEAAVRDGTGRNARLPGLSVAGKTGTAVAYEPAASSSPSLVDPPRNVASFAGFAPADNPALVALVVLVQPAHGMASGGVLAAPVFRSVVAASIPLLHGKP